MGQIENFNNFHLFYRLFLLKSLICPRRSSSRSEQPAGAGGGVVRGLRQQGGGQCRERLPPAHRVLQTASTASAHQPGGRGPAIEPVRHLERDRAKLAAQARRR